MFRRTLLVAGLLGIVGFIPGAIPDPAVAQPAGAEPKELLPKTFTLQSDKVTLSEALQELSKQTGNTVVNRMKIDPTFALKCHGLPFWKALDAIAAAAHGRVSLYQADGNIALIAGPPRKAGELPRSDHGLFRTTVREVANRLDLESGSHTCAIQLEVAWEPRLQPFLLETAPTTILFSADMNGKMAKEALPSRGRVSVVGRNAILVDIRVPAPHRSAAAIAELKGSLVVTAPSKMLTFTFGKLRPIRPKEPPDRQEQEGVSVRLTKVTRETKPDRFNFEVTIDNPPGRPLFESHEGWAWMGNNAIWLEKSAGGAKQILLPSKADQQELERSAARAVVLYSFSQKGNPKVRFGELADWTLVYRTPGRIVELTIP